MKFRLPELLLGCLLTVAVFATGSIFSSSSLRNETAKSVFASTVTETTHSDTADDRIARYTLWLAILTGGLVFTSLFQFYFLNKAEKTSQALARLAREEFVATHRPRVIVRYIQGPFCDNDGDVEYYWATFVNVGETAATFTEFGGDLARRYVDGQGWVGAGLDATPKPIEPIILESGQRYTVRIEARSPISETDLFGDATGTYELCAVGAVRYQDGNGRTRETAFLRTNRGGKGFEASKNKEEEYED